MDRLLSSSPTVSTLGGTASSSTLSQNANAHSEQTLPPREVEVGVPQTGVRRPSSSMENTIRQTVPQRAQTRTSGDLPHELLFEITGRRLAGNPSIRDINRLRNISPALRPAVDDYMQRPAQSELVLRITRESIAAMVRSPNLTDEELRTQVTSLMDRHAHIGVNLRHNASPERRQIVLDCLANATDLRTVDLDASHMGDRFAEVLTAINSTSESVRERNPQLTRFVLDVSRNDIGDAGARALAENATITQLDVSANNIGDAGAQALAENVTIKQLNVSENEIGDAGAQALAANATLKKLIR